MEDQRVWKNFSSMFTLFPRDCISSVFAADARP
jgi:hypothetical protein